MSCGRTRNRAPDDEHADCSEVLHRIYEYLDGEMTAGRHAQDRGSTSTSAARACKRVRPRPDAQGAGQAVLRRARRRRWSCACRSWPASPRSTSRSPSSQRHPYVVDARSRAGTDVPYAQVRSWPSTTQGRRVCRRGASAGPSRPARRQRTGRQASLMTRLAPRSSVCGCCSGVGLAAVVGRVALARAALAGALAHGTLHCWWVRRRSPRRVRGLFSHRGNARMKRAALFKIRSRKVLGSCKRTGTGHHRSAEVPNPRRCPTV